MNIYMDLSYYFITFIYKRKRNNSFITIVDLWLIIYNHKLNNDVYKAKRKLDEIKVDIRWENDL